MHNISKDDQNQGGVTNGGKEADILKENENENVAINFYDREYDTTPLSFVKDVDDESDHDNSKENDNDDTKNIIIISLSVLLIIVLGILVIIHLRKKKEKPEEPDMEKNEVYGEDDEYYDEHDNRIEDKNDYYQS